MKKSVRVIGITALVVVLALIIGGFWYYVSLKAEEEMRREEDLAIEAMFVEIGTHGEYMFVQTDTETPFVAELPDRQVFGEDGKTLERVEISSGDVFKIYGDGAMTMSLPAQYPGITRMERIKWGSPEDTEQYADILKNYQDFAKLSPEEREKSGE